MSTAPRDEIDEEAGEWIDKVLTLMPLLRKEFARGTKGYSKTPCPFCQTRIGVSCSGFNGHLSVACETNGCMSWME